MVKILEEFPLISTGRPPKYNWEEWLDGQPRLIERGVDYHVGDSSFRSMADQAARRVNKRVRTTVQQRGVVIIAESLDSTESV